MKSVFPPPSLADDNGIVCYGGELSTDILKDAYFHGIFPWPHEGYPLLWFSPEERGVLEFSELHVPRSLEKFKRQSTFTWTENKAFEEVIRSCAKVKRKDQEGTWINEEIIQAYIDLQKTGCALSFECWDEGQLVGGLYGVLIEDVFSGESMYGLKDNVSKLCFLRCVKSLQKMGHSWMDIQMITPVTEMLGGKYISREEFLLKLQNTHKTASNS